MTRNRQQRRHPIHPALPLPDSSGKKMPVERTPATRDAIKPNGRKGKNRWT